MLCNGTQVTGPESPYVHHYIAHCDAGDGRQPIGVVLMIISISVSVRGLIWPQTRRCICAPCPKDFGLRLICHEEVLISL